MWEPPKYPGPCFDLHFDRFDGFIFEAEKPFENVCHKDLPSTCGSIFFYICSIASHRTLLLLLSMNLQQLKKLCCWMEWQRKQKEKR